jgi:cyanophycinase
VGFWKKLRIGRRPFSLGRQARVLSIFTLIFSSLLSPFSSAAGQPTALLIPMGGGYSDVYAGFSESAVAHAREGAVNILVLAPAYSSNAAAITEAERATNLRDAEERRFQIEEACKRAAPAGLTCRAVLAPIFVRAEAQAFRAADLEVTADTLAAVFFLGGDQGVAMRVLLDTPLETFLADAYHNGVIIAGTSAGGGLQSRAMLADYSPNFDRETSLNFGAVQMWNAADRRGLAFGLDNAILDQHFFQRGRFGRLLSALALPASPQVGIGVDAYTGVRVRDGRWVERAFGLYSVAVLDAQTYHAADGVRYGGPANTLSLRNVLVHLLAPGDSAYDLQTRQHSLAAPARRLERDFDALRLPPGAGPLIVAGDLSDRLDAGPVLQRFTELAGGAQARLTIVAAGYPSENSARTAAEKYAAALGLSTTIVSVARDAAEPVALTESDAIVLIGRDQSRIHPAALEPVRAAWLAGRPLLADDAGAALLGAFFSAHGPTPRDGDEAEIATQKSFLQGRTQIEGGLGALPLVIEPQVLSDNRWGRVFSLAFAQPELLVLGLNSGSALEITEAGARVLGNNAVLVLDPRPAQRALGTNEGFVIANALLDVFAPGDKVWPEAADVAAQVTPAPTPILAAPTPTPAATTTESPTPLPPTPTAAVPTALPSATTVPTSNAATTVSVPIWAWLGGAGLVLVAGFVWWRRRQKAT